MTACPIGYYKYIQVLIDCGFNKVDVILSGKQFYFSKSKVMFSFKLLFENKLKFNSYL